MEKTLQKANCHFMKTEEGHYLLFKGNTLALFEADQIAFDILQLNCPVDESQIILALSDLYAVKDIVEGVEELRKWRVLFELEDIGRKSEASEESTTDLKSAIGGLWLCVTNDCNLRCKYCAAGHGLFGGEPALMTKEIAKRAISMLFQKPNGRPHRETITFIGGEPLLNFEVIRFTVELSQELASPNGSNVSFAMDTNGTILTDEMIEFLSKNRVDVVFSIDGPEEIQDKNRRFADGSGTYKVVIQNLKRWLKATRHPCRIQSTFADVADMEGSIDHFFELGIQTVIANPAVKTRFSLQKVNPSLVEENKIVETYRKMGKHFLNTLLQEKPKALFSTAQIMNKVHSCIRKGPGCGAGASIAVDSWGNIYPCQGMVGWSDYKLGDVFAGIDESSRQSFIQRKNTLVAKCRGCWALNVCGAACIATAISNGILNMDYPSIECDLRKRLAEVAIQTYAELMKITPALAEKYFTGRVFGSKKCC